MIRFASLIITLLYLSACAQNALDDHYACSYETTEAAYDTCMSIGREVKEDTAQQAGN